MLEYKQSWCWSIVLCSSKGTAVVPSTQGRQLIFSCYSVPTGSDAHFQPLWAPVHMWHMHTYTVSLIYTVTTHSDTHSHLHTNILRHTLKDTHTYRLTHLQSLTQHLQQPFTLTYTHTLTHTHTDTHKGNLNIRWQPVAFCSVWREKTKIIDKFPSDTLHKFCL